MWTIIFVLAVIVAIIFFGGKFLRRYKNKMAPARALLEEIKELEADLPSDFVRLARAEAIKKRQDKQRKRLEAIYLENSDLTK